MARFDGKVVLISGGARGMGAAEARMIVAEGGCVVVGDVLADQGAQLAKDLGAACVFVKLDVGEPADWAAAVAVARGLGGLQGLVNNAGIYRLGNLVEGDSALWEAHLRVNQTGVFLGMKAAVELMAKSGGGSIVNMSSTVGVRSTANAFSFSVSNWAVRGMK